MHSVNTEKRWIKLGEVIVGDISGPLLEFRRNVDVPINMMHKIIPDHFGADGLFLGALAPETFKFGAVRVQT